MHANLGTVGPGPAGHWMRAARKRLSQPRLLAGALVVVALMILAGCGSFGLNRPVTQVSARSVDGRQVAEITLHSYYFVPNRVIVEVGVPVELHLKKKSLFVPHNFSLIAPEAGIEIDENVGTLGFLPGSKTVRFTPRRPGE